MSVFDARIPCPLFEDANGLGRKPLPEDFGFDPVRRWALLNDEGHNFTSDVAAEQAVRANLLNQPFGTYLNKVVLCETEQGGFIVAIEYGYSPS